MADIHYLVGDATEPIGDGPNIIAHVCNNQGAWGAGFTRALSARYPRAEEVYRMKRPDLKLGDVQMVEMPNGFQVANMIAQDGLISHGNPRPLRYDALGACLLEVGKYAQRGGYAVHMPRIGCGLAGGDWMYVEKLIHDALPRQNVPTFVYDLPDLPED